MIKNITTIIATTIKIPTLIPTLKIPSTALHELNISAENNKNRSNLLPGFLMFSFSKKSG
jgi:hypothetical protein